MLLKIRLIKIMIKILIKNYHGRFHEKWKRSPFLTLRKGNTFNISNISMKLFSSSPLHPPPPISQLYVVNPWLLGTGVIALPSLHRALSSHQMIMTYIANLALCDFPSSPAFPSDIQSLVGYTDRLPLIYEYFLFAEKLQIREIVASQIHLDFLDGSWLVLM